MQRGVAAPQVEKYESQPIKVHGHQGNFDMLSGLELVYVSLLLRLSGEGDHRDLSSLL